MKAKHSLMKKKKFSVFYPILSILCYINFVIQYISLLRENFVKYALLSQKFQYIAKVKISEILEFEKFLALLFKNY
jgi:hypothetical protein